LKRSQKSKSSFHSKNHKRIRMLRVVPTKITGKMMKTMMKVVVDSRSAAKLSEHFKVRMINFNRTQRRKCVLNISIAVELIFVLIDTRSIILL